MISVKFMLFIIQKKVVVNPRTPFKARDLSADMAPHLNQQDDGDGVCLWAHDLSEASIEEAVLRGVDAAASMKESSITKPCIEESSDGAAGIEAGEVGRGEDKGGEEEATVQGVEVLVLISTLPAAAGFLMPDWILNRKKKVFSPSSSSSLSSPPSPSSSSSSSTPLVVLDVAYKPPLTPMLRQALNNNNHLKKKEEEEEEAAGEAKRRHVKVVPGATMLVEQGIEQCQLWTQRKAPRQVVGLRGGIEGFLVLILTIFLCDSINDPRHVAHAIRSCTTQFWQIYSSPPPPPPLTPLLTTASLTLPPTMRLRRGSRTRTTRRRGSRRKRKRRKQRRTGGMWPVSSKPSVPPGPAPPKLLPLLPLLPSLPLSVSQKKCGDEEGKIEGRGVGAGVGGREPPSNN
jgi:hypothetical protein